MGTIRPLTESVIEPRISSQGFSGLAWALIFGLFASTLFTLIVIPVTYFAMFEKRVRNPR